MTRIVLAVLLVAMLAGCAGTITGEASAPAAPGGPQRVQLEASNFKFSPNEVKVALGQPVEVSVTNTSSTTHNITVLNPQGNRLASADLPAGATRIVTFTPTAAGRYKFYCDKFGHSTLGMSGQFVAEAK